MAKLVEILARGADKLHREIVIDFEWLSATQVNDGDICFTLNKSGSAMMHLDLCLEKADDWVEAVVTRAQWQAERERQLAELSKFTEADKARARGVRVADVEIGWNEGVEMFLPSVGAPVIRVDVEFPSEAHVRENTAEEQELADIACGKRSKEDQALWDDVAMDQFRDFMQSERDRHFSLNQCDYARLAAEAADAFMAERAKRLKGV